MWYCLCSDSISLQLYSCESLYRQLDLARDSGAVVPVENTPIGLITHHFVCPRLRSVNTSVHLACFYLDKRLMVVGVRGDLSNDWSVFPGRKVRRWDGLLLGVRVMDFFDGLLESFAALLKVG